MMDGVVRTPSLFSTTFGWPPSMTAMQELVVPRSIPRILGIAGDEVVEWLSGERLFRDDDLRRPDDAVVELPAGLEDLDDGAGRLVLLGLLHHHRVMHRGVERDAGLVDGRDARARERGFEL